MSFVKIENFVHSALTKYPKLRNKLGKIYQRGMYYILPKIKKEGEIVKLTPNDEKEYFFGYYDKSPWDITERYVLCLRVEDTIKSVAPKEEAEIIMIDTQDNNNIEVIATTSAWNVQQGCMLQWLGPNYKEEIIFNDFREGNYCSVIKNIRTKEERIVPFPVFSVSQDGNFALSLDFSRLHRLRPGYGYSYIPDSTVNERVPNDTCIWYIDLKTGSVKPILKYSDFVKLEHRNEMDNAEHKVNHIMINPSGTRFMVIHRWLKGGFKYSRLVTCNIDGTGMYNLSDDNFVSHCTWKNDEEILSFLNKKSRGKGYYLLKDRTNNFKRVIPDLLVDGHPSYSPDNQSIVTDTYPNNQRLCSLYVIKGDKTTRIARFFAPFKYGGDNRCDLHPRWDRKGEKICVDSVFEGKRGLYIVPVE